MLIALLAVLGVDGGEVDGLRPKWNRGYGRWVRDVLVWTKGPFLFRNEIVAANGLEEQRPANPDEVKRLGDQPAVIGVRMEGATVEVAAAGADTELLLGPYRKDVT